MEGSGRVILLNLESTEGGACREDPENQESKGKLQGASQRECIIQVREWKVGPAGWKVTGLGGTRARVLKTF